MVLECVPAAFVGIEVGRGVAGRVGENDDVVVLLDQALREGAHIAAEDAESAAGAALGARQRIAQGVAVEKGDFPGVPRRVRRIDPT